MASFDDVRAFFEAPNIAYVGTVRKNGTPHVLPVWVDVEDGDTIVLNSSEGRAWPANVDRTGQITITVADKDDPYSYTMVGGRVISRTTEDGVEVIDRLAKKYLDADSYPFRQEGEQRITYFVEPDRVRHQKQG